MKYNPESFTIGFSSGLFTILGVDPEMIIYKSLAELIKEIGGSSLSMIFMIFIFILLIAEFLVMLSKGENWMLTLLIFGGGFFAGLLFLTATIISIAIISIAIMFIYGIANKYA